MRYKVLITTSGIGSRLGELTKYTNKSLVRAGKKPAISYIVESYPRNTQYVVTLGFWGDQVRDFLGLAYPDRKFEFIEVDKYEGEGTSLGYSMLQAKRVLDCPFIYHASDTIVRETPPVPDKNWIGVYKGNDSSQYASWQTARGSIIFHDKGAADFDYLHIGLVGINDYKEFWSILDDLYKRNPNDSTLNDCATIVKMIESGLRFDLKEFLEWLDVGNIASLRRAREILAEGFSNLDKLEEEIFLFEDFVIKFFFNKTILESRVKRAKFLKGLVPRIEGVRGNFYRYSFVEGDLYSQIANYQDFTLFLKWAKENLWKEVGEIDKNKFKEVCLSFYEKKTKERISKFLEINSVRDDPTVINGELIPPVSDVLKKIDFEWLASTRQHQIHGDLILDNIIKTKEGYCLIDWRQDFGGLLKAGDIYYDLAKLNHNLTVNHDIVNDNLFTIQTHEDGTVTADILVKNSLTECKQALAEFIEKEGLDEKKVSVLTGIIWLNMSPLHHHPFDIFLFYFGKYHLWQALKK